MKSTGMVRKIDEMGRIVVPIEIRKNLDIADGDSLEIFVDGNRVVLQKYMPSCVFCGNCDNIEFFRGKRICHECLERLREQF